jgi:hypothetical protein
LLRDFPIYFVRRLICAGLICAGESFCPTPGPFGWNVLTSPRARERDPGPRESAHSECMRGIPRDGFAYGMIEARTNFLIANKQLEGQQVHIEL